MKGSRTYRPDSDGNPRRYFTGFRDRQLVLPNVRWRCDAGLVHQASWHHNRTLCEMGSHAFIELLHLVIVEPTQERVNCVECIGYATWHDYPID